MNIERKTKFDVRGVLPKPIPDAEAGVPPFGGAVFRKESGGPAASRAGDTNRL